MAQKLYKVIITDRNDGQSCCNKLELPFKGGHTPGI